MHASQYLLLAAGVYLALAAPAAGAQQPAPDINPVPLERPEPLARVKADDPAKLMKAVTDVLRRFSFRIDRSGAALLDAKRYDAADRPEAEAEYDRVIVWLERDFDRPLEYVNLYFLWGRYEMILGRQRGIRRVVPWSERDIPKLKSALAELAQP